MVNFVFAIPVLADDEIGDFRMSKIERQENKSFKKYVLYN